MLGIALCVSVAMELVYAGAAQGIWYLNLDNQINMRQTLLLTRPTFNLRATEPHVMHTPLCRKARRSSPDGENEYTHVHAPWQHREP